MTDNLQNYESDAVVRRYERQHKLSRAEKAILDTVAKNQGGRMLDIGVGAGRTTVHFAGVFKDYIGIDYSMPMIDAARQRFAGARGCSFFHCDARDMLMFDKESFDFILFSFNGIDCVSFADRQKILSEVKRIGKPNSWFAFSSHNLYSLDVLFSFQFPKNPFKYPGEYKRYKGVRSHNPAKEIMVAHDWYPVFDGDINFTAEYVYYKPEKQIEELGRHGFDEVQVFSVKTGKVIPAEPVVWQKVDDPWLYYLCKNSD